MRNAASFSAFAAFSFNNSQAASVSPFAASARGFQREIGVMGPEAFTEWRKALNIMGDHADYHLRFEAPLCVFIFGMSLPFG